MWQVVGYAHVIAAVEARITIRRHDVSEWGYASRLRKLGAISHD